MALTMTVDLLTTWCGLGLTKPLLRVLLLEDSKTILSPTIFISFISLSILLPLWFRDCQVLMARGRGRRRRSFGNENVFNKMCYKDV